jgi:pseudouridine-5'-phosphate glycosidase
MIHVHDEVSDALHDGRPVVALETAVVTAGLPAPVNVEVAAECDEAVRRAGAVPATVGVLDGVLRIGLDETEREALASKGAGRKAAARDLAAAIACGASAGTTVSATLAACRLCDPPIACMATGGIGGVHRGWAERPDVSADLPALASTPACVVASGVKTLLDAVATYELLETFGVPVVAWRCDVLPAFYCLDSGVAAPCRLDDAAAVARLCRAHWTALRRGSAVLLAQPVPREVALPEAEAEAILSEEDADARKRRVSGGARTPWMLERLARRTGGRALAANRALLVENARLAAEVAVEITDINNVESA